MEEYRAKIDAIDDEIAALYAQRMAVVKEIAEAKRAGGTAVADPGRERALLTRLTKAAPAELKLYLKQVYDEILETSRAYQRRLVSHGSPVSDALKKALEEDRATFPAFATVACQGVMGAYSGVAADKLFTLPDVTYCKTFEGVFQAVEKGLCEFGVLPIENSAVGSVNAVYDLMKKHRFYIVRSIKLRVNHCLLAKKGTTKENLTEVFSHEQALNQCSKLLSTLSKSVKVTVTSNTAVAAKTVAESDGHVACISSKECADLYGLTVLDKNVQDADTNFTRFICICKDLRVYAGANKISIMMTLPHEAGSLNRTLNKFSTLGLNLTKLESRPIPNSTFEFMFYFDFEGQPEDADVLGLLSEFDLGSEQFAFLGSFTEI
ncbi:MAG: bifunctional chorismate mutase/prephenate dehydratase [Clostridia bacterium]|nr:bifunctional chorismate mutase/prephenate dehydratase [Clostridia bacterium]